MHAFDPLHSFGPEVAARYDTQPRGDEQVAAGFLAHAAAGGRALEFAIGTGRIALPLSELGVPVDGIELSPAMIEQLRSRPGGEELRIEVGDMSASTSLATTRSPSCWPRTTSASRRRASSSCRSCAD